MRLSKKGMGLIEVLVAGSILSLIMFGVFKATSYTMKGARNVAQKNDFSDMLNTVRLALSNPDLCRCNFAKGTSFQATDTATFSLSVNDIKAFDSSCTPGAVLLKKSSLPSDSGLSVNDITLKNFSRIDDQHYLAKLQIDVGKTQGSLGAPNYRKDVNLAFVTETTSGTVTLKTCSSNESAFTSSGSGSGSSASRPIGFGGPSKAGAPWGIQSYASGSGVTYTVPAKMTLHISTASTGCSIGGISVAGGVNVFLREGTLVPVGGNCGLHGVLYDAAEVTGGMLWGLQNYISNSSPATFVVPAKKMLVLSGAFGSCSLNGAQLVNTIGGIATVPAFFAPMYLKAGTNITLGGNCGLIGTLVEEP